MAEHEKRIDCLGLRCPEPILNVARAASALGSAGGLLDIVTDDAAFPLDLKSWCRSTSAELVSLDHQDQTFHAVVRVPRKPGAAVPTAPVKPAINVAKASITPASSPAQGPLATPPTVLDYRGRRCPEPIVELAKAARNIRGPLEVFADDPAFPLDLKSWCKSSGATVEVLSSDESLHHVLVLPRGISREMLVATVIAPVTMDAPDVQPPAPATPLPAAPKVAIDGPSPFPAGVPTARFDLRDLPLDALDAELAQIGRLRPGMGITLLVPASAAKGALRWCTTSGHELLTYARGEQLDLVLGAQPDEAKGAALALPTRSQALVPAEPEREYDCALLVMHNDLECLLAALLVANSAAAQGMRTMIFFTFWGLNLLRSDRPNPLAPRERVSLMQRMFKWMMPKGPRRQNLGQLNFGGAGAAILQSIMHENRIQSLPTLLASAEEQRVQFIACTMSMTVMGITRRDLEPRPNLALGGVATFVEAGRRAPLTLVF